MLHLSHPRFDAARQHLAERRRHDCRCLAAAAHADPLLAVLLAAGHATAEEIAEMFRQAARQRVTNGLTEQAARTALGPI